MNRRQQAGVAIVTARPALIAQHYPALGVPFRTMLVQPGPCWPVYRPPLVFDTIALAPAELVALLALLLLPPAHGIRILALADPRDWCALRLLRLCPAVGVICPDDPLVVGRWLRYLERDAVARQALHAAIWLVSPPSPLRLDPLLLPALAALHVAPTTQQAAAHAGMSPSTLARLLRSTKTTLGIAPGRFRPDDLARAILHRLDVFQRAR